MFGQNAAQARGNRDTIRGSIQGEGLVTTAPQAADFHR